MPNFCKVLTSDHPEVEVGKHVYTMKVLGISTYSISRNIGWHEIEGLITVEKATLPPYVLRFQEVYNPCSDAVCLMLDSKSAEEFVSQIFWLGRWSWFNHAWYQTMTGIPAFSDFSRTFSNFEQLQAKYPEFTSIFLETVNGF